MKKGDQSSTSSSSYNEIQEHRMHMPAKESKLNKDWEAIESSLYREVTDVDLKPTIIQECRLWRDSFPYLRIRGQKIENPGLHSRNKVKQRVLNGVVNQLIERISGESLCLKCDKPVQRPAAPSRESYFERGKQRMAASSRETTTMFPSADSVTQSSSKPLPRSILKKSPRNLNESTNNNNNNETSKKSYRHSLPRISSKNNRWMNRTESRMSERASVSYRRRRPLMVKEQVVLPPLKSSNLPRYP